MKLKTLLVATSMLAAAGAANAENVSSVSMSPFSAVINFEGGIVENTCQINVIPEDGKGTAGYVYGMVDGKINDKDVNMDTMSGADFGAETTVLLGYYTPATAADWTQRSEPVNIAVNLTNCPTTATAITYQIDGKASAVDPTLLATTGKNGASAKMGIAISNSDGGDSLINAAPIPLITEGKEATETYEVNLFAAYEVAAGTTAADLTQSDENGTAAFVLKYSF